MGDHTLASIRNYATGLLSSGISHWRIQENGYAKYVTVAGHAGHRVGIEGAIAAATPTLGLLREHVAEYTGRRLAHSRMPIMPPLRHVMY